MTDDIAWLQRDRAIWKSFRNVVRNSDKETRGDAWLFINWVMIKYAREAAVTVRRLADPRRGSQSLYRCLLALEMKEEAARLMQLAADSTKYVNKVIAHSDRLGKQQTLNLTQLGKDLIGILTLYRGVYETVTGARPVAVSRSMVRPVDSV